MGDLEYSENMKQHLFIIEMICDALNITDNLKIDLSFIQNCKYILNTEAGYIPNAKVIDSEVRGIQSNKWLSVAELSKQLHKSESTIKRLANKLKVVQPKAVRYEGKKIFINSTNINQLRLLT